MDLTEEPTTNNGEIDNDITDTEYIPEEENTTPQKDKEKTRKKSIAWSYFTIVDEDKKLAKCKTCNNNLNYVSGVSNLMKHIRRRHLELWRPLVVPREYPKKSKLGSKLEPRSLLWQYFEAAGGDSMLANCRLCAKQLSFTTISNLRKHLWRKHAEVLPTEDHGELDVATEETSPVWAYFKCLSEILKIADCLICKDRVDYEDEEDLTSHLRKKHPRVNLDEPKKLIITGDGEVYEIDDDVAKREVAASDGEEWDSDRDEDDATHVEYLEDTIFDHTPSPSTKKRRKENLKTGNSVQKLSSSEVFQNGAVMPTQNQREKEQDYLDCFGLYLVKLLRKLPAHKSDKLQADFIRQIMDAQLDDSRNNSC